MKHLWFALVLGLVGGAAARAAAPVEPLRWGAHLLRLDKAWYASPAARAAADTVLRYQSQPGAWPKNTDLLVPPTPASLAALEKEGKANTIDNGATTLPIRFLARLTEATGEARYRDAVLRGVDYLLASQ